MRDGFDKIRQCTVSVGKLHGTDIKSLGVRPLPAKAIKRVAHAQPDRSRPDANVGTDDFFTTCVYSCEHRENK